MLTVTMKCCLVPFARVAILASLGFGLWSSALARTPDQTVPVVTVVALVAEIPEAVGPVTAFEVRRTGPTNALLRVEFEWGGAAKLGEDFATPFGRSFVEFAAGTDRAPIVVRPVGDRRAEGPENVTVTLLPPVTIALVGVVPPYAVGDPGTAETFIVDTPPLPASVRITRPLVNAAIPVGLPVELAAVAADPAGYVPAVQFFVDDEFVGESTLAFIQAPTNGTPLGHSFTWSNAPAGRHWLRAQGVSSTGRTIRSEAVPFRVVGETPPPSVTVKPLQTEAVEGDFQSYLSFRVERTGNPSEPLVVQFQTEGTATRGDDYRLELAPCPPCLRPPQILPGDQVLIPAEVLSVDVGAFARLDGEAEGRESVRLVLRPWSPEAGAEYRLGESLAAEGFLLDRTNSEPVTVVSLTVTRDSTWEPTPLSLVVPGRVVLRRDGPTNEPLRVLYSVGGTARNGLDYLRLDGDATIAAGARERELVVAALLDPLPEPPETVEITLRAGRGYTVGVPAAGTVTIRDASATPSLVLTRPDGGDEFFAPATITLEAVGTDPAGYVPQVEFFANDEKIGQSSIAFLIPPEPGTVITHTFEWQNVPAGTYVLTARTPAGGAPELVSAPVRVRVLTPPARPFVERTLPPDYAPGTPCIVPLTARPGTNTAAWAVEEQPPAGWRVDELSDNGVRDPNTGKVKFGPYQDAAERVLTYRVTPPTNATEAAEFAGVASRDGQNSRVQGDRTVVPRLLHPADNAPADRALAMAEVTAYAAAWRTGEAWPTGPNPIPVSYVTRAGYLWQSGEDYRHLPGPPLPLAWVPAPARAASVAAAQEPSAAASLFRLPPTVALADFTADTNGPGGTLRVFLIPLPGTKSLAAELWLGTNNVASELGEAAVFDTATGGLRWGPFGNAEPRVLTARLAARPTVLRGQVSADGSLGAVRWLGLPPGGPRIADVGALPDGGLQLVVTDTEAASGAEVEASTDLLNWQRVGRVPAGADWSVHTDHDTDESGHRFYRLRPGAP
jgi:hypothetical protein